MNRDRTRRSDAQMGIDFLTGMTIFILSLFFVMQMMFGMLEPYTSTSAEHVSTVDRVGERLVSQVLADANASQNVINETKTMRFFNGSVSDAERTLGLPRATGINVTLTSDYLEYPPTEDLVGYWAFNRRVGGRVYDTSRLGTPEGLVHGALVGPVERDAVGVMSSPAFRFDGGSEHVRIPNALAFNVSKTDNVTLSMWVRPTTVSTSGAVALFDRFNTSQSHQVYGLALTDDGKPRVTFNDTVTKTHAGNLTPGSWNHVVAVYNGSAADQVTIYLNGSADSWGPGSIDFHDPGSPLLVANSTVGVGSAQFEGAIDELRVYDRALGEDAVHDLYNAGGVLSPDQPNVTTHAALEDTKLTLGEAPPDVADVASRRRVATVPNRSIGPVEVWVRVW